jgi:23S rRNA pseudouridine1911/1915/1917 synthase
MPAFSRVQIQRLIKDGQVRIGGAPVKASLRLEGEEHVVVSLPPVAETELIAQSIPLDIRYEDEDILLVNKPAGMVVHPSAGHETGTLVNAVLAHCPDLLGIGGQRRPGIVHRLDKDTSGLILVAKNDQALHHLQGQFKKRTVEKVYQALGEGHFRAGEALIDAPIGRDPRNRKKMTVIPSNASDNETSLRADLDADEAIGERDLFELLRLLDEETAFR